MNKNQIILGASSQHDKQDDSIDQSQYIMIKNDRKRNNSTEATRQIFAHKDSAGERRKGANNQNSYQSSNYEATMSQQTKQQNRGLVASANYQQTIDKSVYGSSMINVDQGEKTPSHSNLQQRSSQQHRQEISSPAGGAQGEYQSILLTRYLKEPRLPPSSTYYNLSRKKKSLASRGTKNQPQVSLTQKGFGVFNNAEVSESKPASSPSKSMSQNDQNKSRKRALNPANDNNNISYRNQKEIMRKIFGNEQNYHQVKNLLVKAPPYANENDKQAQQIRGAQTDMSKSPLAQKYSNQNQERAPSIQKSSQTNIRPPENQLGTTSPNIGPEEIILAKSTKQGHGSLMQRTQHPESTYQQLKSDRNPAHQSASQLPPPSGNNDQVEKAIFDLQDVKNNYFQEKTMYDQKIQQIQNKTLTNGFGNFPGGTAYNRTATSGFLPATSNGQRPLTQGGAALLLKNQQLMNDNNVLKGDLDQVSKEDLKERLVVAEMVMKKLFQRNKDLEDQIVAAKDESNASAIIEDRPQRVSVAESPMITKKIDNDEECLSCIEVRREMLSKEKEYQERINELHSQLLKKTEVMGKTSHQEYLQIRLEETLAEAKRHFANYINARNTLNSFMESRLNQTNHQGGTKGQKLHNDILAMLKKNLETAELLLIQERDQLKLSYAKTQAQIVKKDTLIKKRDAKIKHLQDEIERRKFVEGKVQRYVKGLIAQNQRHSEFLDQIGGSSEIRQRVQEFKRSMETGVQDGGESTENEEEGQEQESLDGDSKNLSVEVNDL